jgi:tripartite-type tricarboxylate transporter receptor subunit TctC
MGRPPFSLRLAEQPTRRVMAKAVGLFAPAGTPKPIIDRLNKEIFAIVATPDFKSAMEKNGADAVHNSTEQFANLVKIEAGKYGNIVKKLGIKLD